MVTEQASEHNLSDLSGAESTVSTERLLNLLELSNSDLTASTGMEDLPISEMLLDTLLGLLHSERPDLLSHSQRVAFLCYGMGRQFGWAAKRTNTLVTAALLHELGRLAVPEQYSFWDEPASVEELSRYVTIDLLETCHADSDVLEILSHSLHFRYREEPPEESECPTPDHVLLGAAAFQFAHLFEKVRHQGRGAHHLSEIVAALQNVAETSTEELVVSALEEWLAGRDKIIHSFDPSMFFPGKQEMDEETAEFVRSTFIEILEELYKLQNNFDAFFILDSTGRFQLWNSGCQLHHGYTIREMRNKHWHNSLVGYCNHEGLAFSDAQTPLFQTLESGKPAHTTLFLKQGEHHLIEAEVISIPIMGRDKLMLGIVELHRIIGAEEQSPPDILYTPEWIGELASELRGLDHEDPAAQAIPDLDDDLISLIESRLGFATDLAAASETVAAQEPDEQAGDGSSADAEPDETETDSDLEAPVVMDPADSDILTEDQVAKAGAPEQADAHLTETETDLGVVESDTVASEEPEPDASLDSDTKLAPSEDEGDEALADTADDFVLAGEDSSAEELPELGSHLDNLLSRFDDVVTDTDESEDAAAVSDEVEFEEAVPETDDVEAHAGTEPYELEPGAEADEEEREEVSSSVSEHDTSDHVLDSSLDLGDSIVEYEEAAAQQDEGNGIDEEDVLSFLTEDSSVEPALTPEPEQVAGEVAAGVGDETAGVEDTEEPPAQEPAAVETADNVEAVETTGDSSVLDSEEEADFDLDLEPEVTDSELLQALQNEGPAVESNEDLAVEDEVETTAALEEPTAEQAEDAHEEAAAGDAEEVFEEPVSEPAEQVVEEQEAEPVAEDSAESEAPPVVEVAAEPITEPLEEVREERAVEQASDEPDFKAEPEPQPEAEEELAEQEPAAVSETGREETAEPVAGPVEHDPHAAPVSRNEWDAFVNYLLDPNSESQEQVSVLFLDLDRFKAINEGFGRQIGDDLLKEISRRLSEACGARELSCRYGGGQFAIACPGLTLEKAQKRGDQIRKLVERTRFDVLPFQALSVSIGVASSEQGDALNELMNRAEYCLYNAKSSGRNCVVALSSQQIEEELARDEEEITTTAAADKPFEVVSEFEAMIASDMIVYKLGGFLYDMHAKLLHVDKRHVSMRVGSKGFLPYWGRQDDARPVLIDLELGEGWGESKQGKKPSKSSIIHIRIRPDGWVRNQETFHKRAQHVLREIKGYFAGS